MPDSAKKKENFKESDFTEREKHKVKQYIILNSAIEYCGVSKKLRNFWK